MLYHKNVVEAPIQMKTYISGDLPDGVGGSSLKKRKFADDSSGEDNEKGRKDNGKGKQNKSGTRARPVNEKNRVARAMEVVGEAAKERTAIIDRQAKVSTRHAEKTAGIYSAEAYGRFKKSVGEGRAGLRALRENDDYDTESSEAEDLKETIAFFKEEARIIFEELQLQKKSIQRASKPSTITTAESSGHCGSTLSESTPYDSSSRRSSRVSESHVAASDSDSDSPIIVGKSSRVSESHVAASDSDSS
jgi:hypothetical protein